MIDDFRNATIMLPNGTTLYIKDALLSTKMKRNLLSFKDVRRNRYHFETIIEDDIDYLCIISYKMGIKTIHEKINASISGLYCVPIRAIESYVNMSWKLINSDEFGLWHDYLGHLSATMMRMIILNSRLLL